MKKIVFLLLIGLSIGLSSCASLLIMSIPKGTSSSSVTTTTTPPVFGSFTISGTVSSGGLVTTEAVGLTLFASKSDLQNKLPPVSSETHVFNSGSFIYSFATNEGMSYCLVAFYPTSSGSPEWVGGPGINADAGTSQMISNLQTVNVTTGNPNPTVNITLFRITGP